jgi:hypothetical protein
METIGKDVNMLIALNLAPSDLIKYCSTNKALYQEICDSDIFWRKKLEKDYPLEMAEVRNNGITVIQKPKELYMKRFISLASKIEKFIPIFITYNFGEDFIQYLSAEYKKGLFNSIQMGYSKVKNYDFSTNNRKEDVIHDIMMDEIGPYFPNPQYHIERHQLQDLSENILPKFYKELFTQDTLLEILNRPFDRPDSKA